MFRDLSNEHTRRVSAFADRIKSSTSVKFNLAWTYGDYLADVPARLGTNEALDRAADAVLVAFGRFSTTYVDVTPVLLEKYTLALTALRTCLDDPVKAKASETLCAIMLLMICQVRVFTPDLHSTLINEQTFLWTTTGPTICHSEGAAQIIRLRGRADNLGRFENNLLLALRGVVASPLQTMLPSALIAGPAV